MNHTRGVLWVSRVMWAFILAFAFGVMGSALTGCTAQELAAFGAIAGGVAAVSAQNAATFHNDFQQQWQQTQFLQQQWMHEAAQPTLSPQ